MKLDQKVVIEVIQERPETEISREILFWMLLLLLTVCMLNAALEMGMNAAKHGNAVAKAEEIKKLRAESFVPFYESADETAGRILSQAETARSKAAESNIAENEVTDSGIIGSKATDSGIVDGKVMDSNAIGSSAVDGGAADENIWNPGEENWGSTDDPAENGKPGAVLVPDEETDSAEDGTAENDDEDESDESDGNQEEGKSELRVIQGFVIDSEDMICGFYPEQSRIEADGYLEFPAEGCVGIRADAFEESGEAVTEVSLPANITKIETGAFEHMGQLLGIGVEPGNPVYSDLDGVLYNAQGTALLAFPAGRIGMYGVSAETLEIGSRAFSGTALDKIDFRDCGELEFGNDLFGENAGSGLTVYVPAEFSESYAEKLSAYNVEIF